MSEPFLPTPELIVEICGQGLNGIHIPFEWAFGCASIITAARESATNPDAAVYIEQMALLVANAIGGIVDRHTLLSETVH